MNAQHTPDVPKPIGKTRAEFVADVMSDGVTTLGAAMALADAAGKRHGYYFTHEQMYAVVQALAAAKNALDFSGSAASTIREMALVKVLAAIDSFDDATAA